MRTFEVLGPLLEWLNCSTNRGELDCTDKIVKNGVIYYLKDHSGECHVCFSFLATRVLQLVRANLSSSQVCLGCTSAHCLLDSPRNS